MRTIKWSTDFKKDYRRIKATPRHAQDMERLLTEIATPLCRKAAATIPLSVTGKATGNAI